MRRYEQQHLRSVVNKLRPLVPAEVSLKSVTRRNNEQVGDGKLLKGNNFVEGGLELAEREGFEFSLFSNPSSISQLLPNLFLFQDFALVCTFL
jgi:hypothetical protein